MARMENTLELAATPESSTVVLRILRDEYDERLKPSSDKPKYYAKVILLHTHSFLKNYTNG